jgi:hypothetical protein
MARVPGSLRSEGGISYLGLDRYTKQALKQLAGDKPVSHYVRELAQRELNKKQGVLAGLGSAKRGTDTESELKDGIALTRRSVMALALIIATGAGFGALKLTRSELIEVIEGTAEGIALIEGKIAEVVHTGITSAQKTLFNASEGVSEPGEA